MRKIASAWQFRLWLAIAGTATLTVAVCYTMVQQSTRLSANDLPLTTAQTVKAQLEAGATPADVVSARAIDLRNNYNVFTIITDSSHHMLASSASLDGQTPLPPVGTFDFTAVNGSDHFTWQTSGVRLATQLMSYTYKDNHGFIVTGQSLKPFEDRVNTYGQVAITGWIAILLFTYLVILLPKADSYSARSK